MTLQVFCPKWYFQTRLSDEAIEQTKELFDEFLNNDDHFHQPPNWSCNVQSSWQKMDESDGPWTEWLNILQPVWNEFMDEVGVMQNVEIAPNNAWANKYDPGDSQETHDHCTPSSNLSMVYFHTVNDDDGAEFAFYNVEHAAYQMQGLSDTVKSPTQQTTVPKVVEGDVIIFPSHYHHLVSPHRGTKTRITFSLNFQIRPVSVPQPPQLS